MYLPKRKPNRLNNYDYSSNGAYFITVCTKNKEKLFGNVIAEHAGADSIRPQELKYKTSLSSTGETVKTAIEAIGTHYPHAVVANYVIMPNHIHLLIVIKDICSDGRIVSAPTDSKKSLEIIIGQMKRWVSKQTGSPVWQKSYYDHIIRNSEDFCETWNYIEANPRCWYEKQRRGG